MRTSKQVSLVVVVLAMMAIGCASASVPKAMVPAPAPMAQRHTASVSVSVSGGKETNPAMMSQIADADFRAAIVEAIQSSKVFAAVSDRGDYQLHVHISKLDQPLFGASFTVTMESAWRLVRSGSDEPVLEAVIQSSGTATMGDAFAGPKRLRLANEAAARESIRIGLERLSRVHVE